MRRRLPLMLGVAGLLALAAAWFVMRSPGEARAVAVACTDIVAGCSLPAAGLQVAFDQPPQALQPFVLKVRTAADQVYASFSMRGMQMGFNRYRLLPQADGSWRAQVTLPACVQGRNDWELLLEIDARRYVLPFSAGVPPP